MERNRRVAKAYARLPLITINNRSRRFDGNSIGLTSFDNPYRDNEILSTHKSIGKGIAIGADEEGNILVQLINEQRNLYMREINSSCADDSLIKQNGKIKPRTVYKIFCMKKFLSQLNQLQTNTNSSTNGKSTTNTSTSSTRNRNGKFNSTIGLNKRRTISNNNTVKHTRRHSNPDDDDDDDEDENYLTRISLENKCFSVISFSSHSDGQMESLLDTPVWIIVINIIALEMLHRNLNISKYILTRSTLSLTCLI